MKSVLFLAFLLLPFAALAQSETCPRIWRSGDSLLTDPAPAIQWQRDGQAIPGANARWLVPTEAGRYSVEALSGLSVSFLVRIGRNFALAGYVFDELHRPVNRARIKCRGFSAYSDTSGRFALQVWGEKPDEATPVVLVVEKDGHWRNASRQYVSAFDTTETRIMLHTLRVTNRVDATKGGEMAYQGFTLQLPPNAVQTESGTPYSGMILLSVEGSTPSNPDFGLRMPGGSFDAIDESGNDVMLYSYGYLSAEMTTESGEKLELRPEARATLRFYLPWNETHRPDSVPLWHFNENTAVWEQEGWSVRNGSIYEGEVSHFSSWNCDWPAERGTCKGRVVDCNDEPIKGGWVRIGQRNVVSDSLGNYWAFVPGGVTFDAWAATDTLREIAIPVTEERTLEDLTGRDFEGIAVWNPVAQTLGAYMSGNVPENLRLSIDGGANWTEEREFAGINAAPSEVLLEEGCTERLKVFTLPRTEDCRTLDSQELARVQTYRNWDSALASQNPVYSINLLEQPTIFWDLLPVFSCLQILNLSQNRLTALPESIGKLTELQRLYCRYNSLTSLPVSIGNLTALQTLDLSNNRSLSSLPSSIGNLTTLQEIRISESGLTALPSSIGDLKSLQSMFLSSNQITSLPSSIGNLLALQKLHLSSNRLSSLPSSIGNLTALQQLSLGRNQITSLPSSFCNLNALRFLELDNNRLASLPECIWNFTALQVLTLRSSNLTSLSESIGNLTALKELQLSDNDLTALPESAWDLTAMLRLGLSSNAFTELPERIGNLTALESLYLNNNSITSLPESIGNLTALQFLELSNNALTALPESFGNLSALQELQLGSNGLNSLPESIGNLSALNLLDLSQNQLTYLPESFGNLSALQELRLASNGLRFLPESFANLNQLQSLSLSSNPMDSLPDWLRNFNQLYYMRPLRS